MKTKVIENRKDKQLMLEGTEDILLDIPEEDKFFILALASDLNVNEFGNNLSRDTVSKNKERYTISISRALKSLIIALAHYYYNLPKGFKRINNSNDIVNEDGVVLRFNRKPITYYINNKGYVQTPIFRRDSKKRINKSIHRIVAETFIPNPENKPQVNHIDCDKTNNKKSNLEWNTQEENMKHAKDNGLRDTPLMREVGKGEKNSQAVINKNDVIKIREIHSKEAYKVKQYLANLFNIDMSLLEDVLVFKNKIKVPTQYKYRTFISKLTGKPIIVKRKIYQDEESYIRGYYIKTLKKLINSLSKKFNITQSSIKNVLTRRSWDYNDC